MTYTATKTTKSGITVVSKVTMRPAADACDVYITAAGVYYDSAATVAKDTSDGQARANEQAREAVRYLDSALTADELALLHPDLRAALISQRLIGWTTGDGSSPDGYHAEDYFSGPRYLGPDEHGIEPIFATIAAKFEDPYTKPGPARGGSTVISAQQKYKRDPDRAR